MATSNEKRQEYRINASFPAIVSKIKDDRVFFNIVREIKTKNGVQTVSETAAFFVKGQRFNPHKVFHKGQFVPVTVTKICKPPKNYYGLCYIVTPKILPIDIYIASNPIGSIVSGTINAIHGSTMTVMLAENVLVITKRSHHARTGEVVNCKIDNYRRQRISLRVIN